MGGAVRRPLRSVKLLLLEFPPVVGGEPGLLFCIRHAELLAGDGVHLALVGLHPTLTGANVGHEVLCRHGPLVLVKKKWAMSSPSYLVKRICKAQSGFRDGFLYRGLERVSVSCF